MAGSKDYNLFFEMLKDFNNKIILYGAGRYGGISKELLEEMGIEIHSFCDLNPNKVGGTHFGKPIIGISDLVNFKDYLIIISIYDNGGKEREKICEKIERLGVKNVFNINLSDISVKNFNEDKLRNYNNKEQINYFSYKLLEDDYSKELFIKWLCYKTTKDSSYIRSISDKEYKITEFTVKYDMIDEFKKAFYELKSVTVFMNFDNDLEYVLNLLNGSGYRIIELYKNRNELVIRGEK